MVTLPGAGVLVSADSHVIEPVDVWDGILPEEHWTESVATFSRRPGGHDPRERVKEMEADGVSAEVLYPSLALELFGIESPQLQATAFRRYNEWLAEYRAAAPDRLVAIGLVPAYDPEVAVAEARWCHAAGMRGVEVWQSPPPDLAFSTSHYEELWSVCEELGLPVSMHILTGHAYRAAGHSAAPSRAISLFRSAITVKMQAVTETLLDLVVSGTFDRHPELRLVLVENEAAWLPFFVDQADYYFDRFNAEGRPGIALSRRPSEVFAEQIYVTFFRDPNILAALDRFGSANFMWSSDYPHENSTWPHSRAVVAERIGSLDAATFDALTHGTVCGLYDLDVVLPVGAS